MLQASFETKDFGDDSFIENECSFFQFSFLFVYPSEYFMEFFFSLNVEDEEADSKIKLELKSLRPKLKIIRINFSNKHPGQHLCVYLNV